MPTLLEIAKPRAISAEVTIIDGQTLNLTLTHDDPFPDRFRSVLVQRKNASGDFNNYSIGEDVVELHPHNTVVAIPIPGTYRVLRQSLENYIAVGVTYDITLDATDPDQPLSTTREDKDENGVYVTINFYRPDNTLAKSSQLSGGTSPEYTTRTETWYGTNGTTVLLTRVYALAYDAGTLVSETLS